MSVFKYKALSLAAGNENKLLDSIIKRWLEAKHMLKRMGADG